MSCEWKKGKYYMLLELGASKQQGNDKTKKNTQTRKREKLHTCDGCCVSVVCYFVPYGWTFFFCSALECVVAFVKDQQRKNN